ncbi:hypothetical protein KQH82_06575 [bacterium]|nr:hypothetical protein [bacterium]
MRLVEEKKMILAEAVILLTVGLIGVFVHVASLKTDEYNSSLLRIDAELSQLQSKRISQKLSSIRYTIAALARADITVDSEQVDSVLLADTTLWRLSRDYSSGEISSQTYFNDMAQIHYHYSLGFYREYQSLEQRRDQLRENVPFWSPLRYILLATQVIAIPIAFFLYSRIFTSISSRSK